MLFVPAWTIKSSGLFFENLSNLSKILSLVPTGISFTLTKFPFDKPVPLMSCSNDFKSKETVGTFYEKKFQKTNQNEFRVEDVIKRKRDRFYVKCKHNNSFFNSWIDKENKK